MSNYMVLDHNVILHQLGTMCYYVTSLLAEAIRE